MALESAIQPSSQMKAHNPIGHSDPISYTCTCGQPGSVLLFYRYFANNPHLPEQHFEKAQDPEQQASFHHSACGANRLMGKIRVSKEGFNVTVAGSREGIEKYIKACIDHWSFWGLSLTSDEGKKAFFKPTPGCSCCFPSLSIRCTSEITPLGVTNYSPSSWSNIVPLPPAEFHKMAKEEDVKLVDVRNHYESRIGFFVDGKGREAIKPALRRFGQWPRWVREHGEELVQNEKPIMSYCTGGIRCEKGARWMDENLPRSAQPRQIHTLDGGIATYLTWMKEEIKAGRTRPEDSLFKGQNYVFDARGSLGIEGAEPVSKCHVCGTKSARLGKCATDGCHLVLVVCEECEKTAKGVRCCENCLEVSMENETLNGAKKMCKCEQEREKDLWGNEIAKPVKTQGWKKEKRKMAHTNVNAAHTQKHDICVKVIQTALDTNEIN